jgi:hypothetical protein
MISSFNLLSIQKSVEDDLTGLGMYLQQLVGEPFLFFRESYGGELTIHFGIPKERKSPKLKNRVRGSYVLSVRGSLWMMVAAEKGTLVLSDPPKQVSAAELKKLSPLDIEASPVVSPGSPLVWALPYADDLSGGIGLALGFSDQTRFIIRPEPPYSAEATSDNEDLPEIADWEMYTPIGRCLTVGPGQKWAYLPSTKEEKQ